jgi:HK97 family phage prohead protease
MAIKSDREYRNFKAFELRAEPDASDKKRGGFVEGYASTFEEYDLFKYKNYLGETEIWREQIDRDAFKDADMSDVVFLRDHEGQVYARTKNGLIELTVDDTGLFTRTDLDKTSAAREMYEDIEVGNYTQMSFAFRVKDSKWETFRDENAAIVYKRTITAIEKIYDISAVAFPANPTTNISPATREAFDGAIESIRAEGLEAERQAQEQARQKLEIIFRLMEVTHD